MELQPINQTKSDSLALGDADHSFSEAGFVAAVSGQTGTSPANLADRQGGFAFPPFKLKSSTDDQPSRVIQPKLMNGQIVNPSKPEAGLMLEEGFQYPPVANVNPDENIVQRAPTRFTPFRVQADSKTKEGRPAGQGQPTREQFPEIQPNRPAAMIQRTIGEQDISTNVFSLTRGEEAGTYDAESTRRLLHRLVDIDILPRDEFDTIAWDRISSDPAVYELSQRLLRQSMSRFQEVYRQQIEERRQAILSLENESAEGGLGAIVEGTDSGQHGNWADEAHTSGLEAARQPSARRLFATDDATHQVLASATWPRIIFGIRMTTEAQAYDFISNLVEKRGLPFDHSRVNIVGVRGYQGGGTHDNPGVRTRNNTYNDTFFLLYQNRTNAKILSEFKGTTDPGGRTGYETREDDRTYLLGADQQVNYAFSYQRSSKFGRPMLGQLVSHRPRRSRTSTPGVIDPGRSQIEAQRASRVVREGGGERNDAFNLPAGVDPSIVFDSLRTEYGTTERNRLDGQISGIAIHSGQGGDRNLVNGDSTGCQVVHGDWYGPFIHSMRRGLTERRHASGGTPTEAEGALDSRGQVLYSIIDGRDFRHPSSNPREAGQ